jgi:hypothetical protein
MASSINASTSPAAIVQTADGTANLNLQSNGTTIAALTSTGMAVTGTLSASGAATLSSTLAVTGDLSFNSGYGSSAVAYGCRAWVNFNGTGTVAIRASGNVSSITDNGTGDYTVNFTTAMPDANYNINGNNQAIAGTANPWIVINGYAGPTYQSPTTAACRIFCQQSGAGYDSAFINLSFFR